MDRIRWRLDGGSNLRAQQLNLISNGIRNHVNKIENTTIKTMLPPKTHSRTSRNIFGNSRRLFGICLTFAGVSLAGFGLQAEVSLTSQESIAGSDVAVRQARARLSQANKLSATAFCGDAAKDPPLPLFPSR
jgi:hypothetical protein